MKKFIKTIALTGAMAMSISAYAGTLVFGTIPDAGTGDLDTKYNELLKHVEKETGHTVKMIPIQSYSALVLAMKTKKVDFAYMGAKLFVEAKSRANATAINVELDEQGTPGYRSIIVTAGKTPAKYKHIKDFKGKKFAFVDLNSTSGGLIPTMYFNELGINPKEFFSHVLFTGSHEAAMMSVRQGKVDVAVTNDLDMLELIRNGRLKEGDFRVLWKSDLIPGSLFATSGHVSADKRMAIQNALASFKNDDVFKKLGIAGFAKTDNSMYEPIVRIVEEKKKKAAAKKN